MQVEARKVTVRELCEDYFNDDVEGVEGYGGRLDIRPPYQREFVYKDRQRDEVIRTVRKGFPLGLIYWATKVDDPDAYEVLDGQQRTISICEYVDGSFMVDDMYFHTLPKDQQEQILDYKLDVYVCSGPDSEKLDWFKVINIAGEELTDQELRNAVYSGKWTSDARRYFSKPQGPAYMLSADYMKGDPIRQDYLETVLSWVADAEGLTIEQYMSTHQLDKDAKPLWEYFRKVISWVKKTFTQYRAPMKGLPWGLWYNANGRRTDLDPVAIEADVKRLMADEDVTKKGGIYLYELTGDEKALSIRAFDRNTKIEAYERQNHRCAICGKPYPIEQMQADHIVPWSKGGHTVPENCQMLCTKCNLLKSNK